MLEKILAEYLNITCRKVEDKKRSLNLIREDDRAYVRCKFKRLLKSKKPKEIALINDKEISIIENKINFNSIYSLNKILEFISIWYIHNKKSNCRIILR